MYVYTNTGGLCSSVFALSRLALSFMWTGLILIPAWINNYTHYVWWNYLTKLLALLHFGNGLVIPPQFIAHVITYPCWTFKLIRVSKRGPGLHSDKLNVLSLICTTNNSGTRTLFDWKQMLFSCSIHVLFDLFGAFDIRANLVICAQYCWPVTRFSQQWPPTWICGFDASAKISLFRFFFSNKNINYKPPYCMYPYALSQQKILREIKLCLFPGTNINPRVHRV